ncbi:MAG: AAA family ATPase [Anaerolineae bacterium]|nr:AAA family ATPase [Anaerolineae bacterium]
MQIRQVVIRRFRGIKELNWIVPALSSVCVIGKGDSTKSTILDAIEYALSPRWRISITDADFYQCNTEEPIEIYVTVGCLPTALLPDERAGLYLRGWRAGRIEDEPQDESEPVVTIKLTINSSLEPEWYFYKPTGQPERRISSKEREMLGVISVRNYADRDFSWGRGSSLSRLTSDTSHASQAITDARRAARRNMKSANMPSLEMTAKQIQDLAAGYGLAPQHDAYKPALDSGIINGLTALTLHDGDIPIRMLGLGSKRLLSVGIQAASIPDGAILLLDEVEQGLEPYRLRNLLRKLRENSGQGQVFMTTHSPVAIDELAGNELFVARNRGGVTTVDQVPESLGTTLKSAPEAPLSSKILVCEGDTEQGFCRALDAFWENQLDGRGFCYLGLVSVVHQKGGGGASPKLASQFCQLDYDVALFIDGDRSIPDERELEKQVTIVKWDDSLNIEKRVCNDLPWRGLQEVIDLAIRIRGEQAIQNSVETQLGIKAIDMSIDTWLHHKTEEEIRDAVGSAASKGGWFKDVQKGQLLGELVANYLSEISHTDLAIKIEHLKTWAYGNHT